MYKKIFLVHRHDQYINVNSEFRGPNVGLYVVDAYTYSNQEELDAILRNFRSICQSDFKALYTFFERVAYATRARYNIEIESELKESFSNTFFNVMQERFKALDANIVCVSTRHFYKDPILDELYHYLNKNYILPERISNLMDTGNLQWISDNILIEDTEEVKRIKKNIASLLKERQGV